VAELVREVLPSRNPRPPVAGPKQIQAQPPLCVHRKQGWWAILRKQKIERISKRDEDGGRDNYNPSVDTAKIHAAITRTIVKGPAIKRMSIVVTTSNARHAQALKR
jgi:hypothetical protein